MTEAATSALQPQTTQYIQAWAESLAQVLGQISGSPLPCIALSEAPAELPAPGDGDLWMVSICTAGLRGETSLRLPSASVLRLAEIFMSEPANSAVEITADHREAAIELMRQVGGLVASALRTKWGEVQLSLTAATSAPSWPASSTTWFQVGNNPPAALLEAQLSAALVAALRAEKPEAAQLAANLPASAPPAPEQSKNKLDLLMDVEMAVTLRFGSRRLFLREVLDLIPGTVVDLDRQVEDPVDVLLDGRLVARGEVVVMDGNYGVRVTEVAPSSL